MSSGSKNSVLGLSRMVLHRPEQDHVIWNWSFKDFQHPMTKANKFISAITYARRRFTFAKQLNTRMLKNLDQLQTYEFENDEIRELLRPGRLERKERLLDRLAQLENYMDQTECMQKRAENLVAVLYTNLSQIDSRNQRRIAKINLQIAQAVRSDSIPMRTVAYVSLILLPPAFISSLFGMNFFQFDAATRTLLVVKSFWQYWAVTIPVTISVVLIWNIWVCLEKRGDVGNGNGMQFPLQEPEVGEKGVEIMK